MTKTKKRARRPQPQQTVHGPKEPGKFMLAPAAQVREQRGHSNQIIEAITKTAVALATKEGGVAQVEIMERLWSMQKDAEDRQAEREFGIAKVALAMELPTIPKNHKISFIDKTNNLQEREYADRVDIESVLDPICRKHGFSKEYSTDTIDGKAAQILIVRHVTGHKEAYKSPYMPLDTTGSKNNNQAAGSTAEYGKRYVLIGAFNIIGVDKDDDGNLGADPGKPPADKFTDRVKGDAEAKAETKPPETVSVEEAANMLETKLRNEVDIPKRGKILMNNIRVIEALDKDGNIARAQALRDLAEGKIAA